MEKPLLGMNTKEACTVKIYERPYILLTDTVFMESISDMYYREKIQYRNIRFHEPNIFHA